MALLGVPLSAVAETRLWGASYSHQLQYWGSSGDYKIKGIDTPWHGHGLYIFDAPPGRPAGPESEAWGDVTTNILPDGFSLDSKLRTRTVNTGFWFLVSTRVEVTFTWRIQIVGQNETLIIDAPNFDTNSQGYGGVSMTVNYPSGFYSVPMGTPSVQFAPGDYQVVFSNAVNDSTYQAPSLHDWHSNYAGSIHFTNLVIEPGAFQHIPYLPCAPNTFCAAHIGGWIDPPLAQGYTFTSTGTAQFRQIMAFPRGIQGDYYVTTEGMTLGPFTPEDSVNFQALLGHPVSSFVLKGIKPFVDATSPVAFPIMLEYTEPTADFTMVPIAAPDIALETQPNGDVKLTFTGVLQSSPDLATWTDVTPTPASAYVIPQAQVVGAKYFRSRDP